MKLFNFLGWTSITLAISTVLYVLWLIIFPLQVVTIKNIPFKVLNHTVMAGTNVEFRADYCAYVIATAQVVQYFTDSDGRLIILDPKAFTTSIGCFTPISTALVPSTLVPGTYTLHTAATYNLNFLHQVITKSETEPFEVTR